MMRRLLLVTVVASLAVLGAASSVGADNHCGPPGGAGLAPLPDFEAGEVAFVGRGWGHGIGMNQHGAQGAALDGCRASQILETYFPGTRVQPRELTDTVRVSLAPDGPGGTLLDELEVRADGGDVTWHDRGDASLEVVQPAGTSWTLEAENGELALVPHDEFDDFPDDNDGHDDDGNDDDGNDDDGNGEDENGDDGDERIELQGAVDGNVGGTVELPHKPGGGGVDRSPGDGAEGLSYRGGTLHARADENGDDLRVRHDVGLETYMEGIREVPDGWHAQAIRAQVVAARSYVEASISPEDDNGWAYDVYDSVASQVYRGHTSAEEAPNWVAQVQASEGEVVVDQDSGQVVQAFYSSSSGGQTSLPSLQGWGGDQPWFSSFDDSRWEQIAGNPYDRWGTTLTLDELSDRLSAYASGNAGIEDVGPVVDLEVEPTEEYRGRVGPEGVTVRGAHGTETMSGAQLRSALGVNVLRSSWFDARVDLACEAPEDVEFEHVQRVRGADRVATAVEVSHDFDRADDVIVASARDFPDALAGGALAASHEGPLLLTEPDHLPGEVATRLEELDAERVLLLGGTRAVADEVEETIDEAVETVERVSGADRFATASMIAGEVDEQPDEVLLARGQAADPRAAWPDALAAGALLATDDEPAPLLLTRQDDLPEATLAALEELAPARVTLLGGEAAISGDVAAQVEALGVEVDRLSGEDRWGTSATVAEEALERGAPGDGYVVASGEDFPDALAAGPLASERGDPLLLVPHCDLGPATAVSDVIESQEGGAAAVVGGSVAVSDLTVWQLDELLDEVGVPEE
ncbi:hypothetical protein ER308_06500 [Egibacter rhizosphaerae]|uniref:Sporulation stage II protein D amidase enhancer LytB N-terminal domain-containing protein n=1 Tax=Egibacter rhizosphaerae TaxID=1670831 RepID=A0A411YDC6_9ACTN|nr:cell wall-binding repeat-containing protein [Egibacter rhizosphaerae]QBI19223.1 hypothetical protein ER308_06500 [Egibacter rhizosphaerae]